MIKVYTCDIYTETTKKAVEIYKKWIKVGDIHLLPCPIKGKTTLAEEMAKIKLINPYSDEPNNPFPIEIEVEEKKLMDCKCGKGNVYNGIAYMRMIRRTINLHKIEETYFVTPEYIATKGSDRYHLRYAVFGVPSIISLWGIVEAPARRREYYIAKKINIEIPYIFDKEAIYNLEDERIPLIIAGTLLKGFFYYRTGSPFCDNPNCILYDAHWQSELINSHREEPYLICQEHLKTLKTILQ